MLMPDIIVGIGIYSYNFGWTKSDFFRRINKFVHLDLSLAVFVCVCLDRIANALSFVRKDFMTLKPHDMCNCISRVVSFVEILQKN
jgi:hypothetical protein